MARESERHLLGGVRHELQDVLTKQKDPLPVKYTIQSGLLRHAKSTKQSLPRSILCWCELAALRKFFLERARLELNGARHRGIAGKFVDRRREAR